MPAYTNPPGSLQVLAKEHGSAWKSFDANAVKGVEGEGAPSRSTLSVFVHLYSFEVLGSRVLGYRFRAAIVLAGNLRCPVSSMRVTH